MLTLTLYIAVFPGYYTGRATHIHTKVFPQWSVLPNGTFEVGRLSHTGQFFFDDEINLQIDKVRVFFPFLHHPLILKDLKRCGRTTRTRFARPTGARGTGATHSTSSKTRMVPRGIITPYLIYICWDRFWDKDSSGISPWYAMFLDFRLVVD